MGNIKAWLWMACATPAAFAQVAGSVGTDAIEDALQEGLSAVAVKRTVEGKEIPGLFVDPVAAVVIELDRPSSRENWCTQGDYHHLAQVSVRIQTRRGSTFTFADCRVEFNHEGEVSLSCEDESCESATDTRWRSFTRGMAREIRFSGPRWTYASPIKKENAAPAVSAAPARSWVRDKATVVEDLRVAARHYIFSKLSEPALAEIAKLDAFPPDMGRYPSLREYRGYWSVFTPSDKAYFGDTAQEQDAGAFAVIQELFEERAERQRRALEDEAAKKEAKCPPTAAYSEDNP